MKHTLFQLGVKMSWPKNRGDRNTFNRNKKLKARFYSAETEAAKMVPGRKNYALQRQRANDQIKAEGRKSLELYKSRGREAEFYALIEELKLRGVHYNMKVYDKEGNLIPLMNIDNKPVSTNSKYTKTVAKEIVNRIINGETLKTICESEHLPKLETIRKWYRDYPGFARQIDEAYTERADYYVDQLYDLMEEVKTKKLGPREAAFVADQIKWMAERLNPKYLNKNRNDSPINVNVSDDGKVNFQILLHNPQMVKQIEDQHTQDYTPTEDTPNESDLGK